MKPSWFVGVIAIVSPLVSGAAPESKPVKFSDIETVLNDSKPESVEALIKDMPSALFDDYVLMRETDSSQSGSAKTPRVITFGGGGDLVVAWGHDGKSVEAIEFNRKTRRWDFYEVSFKDGPGKVTKNPARCFGCHQTNARPNWHTYALWPGAYGENERLLPDERKDFLAFVKEKGLDPRYKRLADLGTHFDQPGGAAEPNTRFTATLARRNFERIAGELQKRRDFDALKYALAAMSVPGCIKLAKDGTPTLAFLPADSELRKRAEKLLGDRFRAQLVELQKAEEETEHAKRFGPRTVKLSAVPYQATLALLEAAGRAENGANWTLSNDPTYFHMNKDRTKAYTKDPMTHGFGGGEMLLPWGIAQVDTDVAATVKPYMSTIGARLGSYGGAKDGDTAAQRRFREKASAIRDYPRLDREKESEACDALTKKSLAALKGFVPPKDEKKSSDKDDETH